MTIKDIAALAGVSTSTVSKIMNNKDSHINENTRKRVLSIIKEYNYKPYANIRDNTANTFTLGVVFSGKRICMDSDILFGISSYAQSHGYAAFALYSTGTTEEDLKALSLLISRNVSGIVWKINPLESGEAQDEEAVRQLHAALDPSGIPYVILSDLKSEHTLCIDHEEIGYALTERLIELHHTEIGCVIQGEDAKSQAVLSGFRRCLMEHGLLCQPSDILYASELHTPLPEAFLTHSALLSSHHFLALSLYGLLLQNKYSVPGDISIVSPLEDSAESVTYPQITGIRILGKSFGEYVCKRIITLYETGLPLEEDPKNALFSEICTPLTEPVTLEIGRAHV